jgi:hypothetical protein
MLFVPCLQSWALKVKDLDKDISFHAAVLIHVCFHFEITVDSCPVVRNNTERAWVPCAYFLQ